MVTVKLKGLAKVTSKGHTYYYAWRGGPRIHSAFGSPEFVGEFFSTRAPLTALDRRLFAAWVTLYKASNEFTQLANSTRRNWAPMLDEVKEHFGSLRAHQFDRPQIRVDIRKWRERWLATPRTADFAKQVLSRICSYMVAEGVLRSNPCEGIPNLYKANRSDIIWTEQDLESLCTAGPPEIAWAARLAAHTGLRRGDLLLLSWSHIGELAIEVTTGKGRGKRKAIIPLTSDLRQLIATIPKRATTVLTNTYGKPWASGFSSSWEAAMKRSGLPRAEDGKGWILHFHDFRGTAATNLFRAGFTTREIAQVVGWGEERVERLLDRYVRRDEIMRDRIRRLDEFEAGTKSAKLAAKPGG